MAAEINYNGNKGFRLLRLNERLNKGEILYKSELALEYGVTEKTIQRDIDDLREYFSETCYVEGGVAIKYDKSRNGYYLVHFESSWFTNEEVLALSKVILESRAFCKEELDVLMDKMLAQATPADQKLVKEIIRNEHFHYVQPQHKKKVFSSIWQISQYISSNEVISVSYTRKDGVYRTHKIKPVSIIFSEYYFYLIAFMADDSKDYPTIFRIDRIEKIEGQGEKFRIPYKDKFNDGEFRKRVQFMFSGPLHKVRFEYSGKSIESVLDRLPTAEIVTEEDGKYVVSAEVYGDGIYMWLRSQGEHVKVRS